MRPRPGQHQVAAARADDFLAVLVEQLGLDAGERFVLAPAPDVFPGMFARLEIPLREEERLFVPRAAIIQSGQLDFVYIETEEGPERRSVRIGADAGDDVEITSGLSAGDVVIVPGPVGSE